MNPLYSRHYSLKEFNAPEQQALQNASVLIVGCGGLGNLAAMYLTTAGIGRLVVNDFDTVDQTNLQRQLLFQGSDVGKNKALIAKEKLSQLNADCTLEAIVDRLNLNELIDLCKGFTAILDCSDNFGTRLNLNQVSVSNRIPLISGAAIRFEGQLSVFDPRDKSSPCYQCFHQDGNEDAEDCEGNGILAPVTGVIASSMAVECIKLITEIGENVLGRLQLYDAKHAQWRDLKLSKDPNCTVCSA